VKQTAPDSPNLQNPGARQSKTGRTHEVTEAARIPTELGPALETSEETRR
jgi:hypothetical protein